MKIGYILVLVIFLAMLISGCVSGSSPDQVIGTPGEVKSTTPAPANSWQQEWERILAEARKEGKVAIYTYYGSTVVNEFRKAFKEKYGLELEFVSGNADAILVKLENERRAGILISDLFINGGTFTTRARDREFLDPIKPILLLPEVIDNKAWFEGHHRYVDREGIYGVAFSLYPSFQLMRNTDIVKSNEVVSFRDVLDPKWKGKLVMLDPSASGPSNYWFSWMVEKVTGLDYMRALVKQEPVITRNDRLLWEWVAHGKYPVGISGRSDMYVEFAGVGAPVEPIWPREGTYWSGGSNVVSLTDKAPHPNAAKVFINWLLTKEGQTIVSKVTGKQSGRLDVPTDFLDPYAVRDPSKPYFILDQEEFLSKLDGYKQTAAEIFNPLLK